ncbi:probable F-box protein At5g04010 [Andrographis paniculata]|uniref:probable F-box protein At5g04010 n=1 Tax=Andrographis paniculata TaxID=175694 RepID=UPI0021E9879E|nr:probable F-box protein At5g04010 [Andrographis paniculata]
MPIIKSSPPPWQVLDLVAQHLDPESLAAASCVSKSWSISMSSDHLWQPLCSAAYPSLSALRARAGESVPYRRLYSLGRVADNRRLRSPPKPRLSLGDLLFSVDIHSRRERIATVVKPGRELQVDRNEIFRFDMEVETEAEVEAATLEKLRITWNVVVEGYKGVFGMMECEGKGNFVFGLEGWFSKELPAAGCCSGGGVSGLVADLRLGFRHGGGEGKAVVERVSVGVLNIVSWRYVWVEDALRYLQHFLLPSFD